MKTPAALKNLKTAFIGLNTRYPCADGGEKRRIYLDSSASTLMLLPAYETARSYLEHYANTHTTVHTSAKITSTTMAWAHQRVLRFLGADTTHYISTFLGSGTTAAINRIAAGLSQLRPERDVVLISSMEHHSNDLPHRHFAKQVEHIPLTNEGQHPGIIDIDALAALLKKYDGKVNYIAVTAASNVTGILNPLKKITELAHQYDTYVLVDGAQMTAHAPANLSLNDIDFYVFSGHKVYAPGSPGVLVGKRNLINAMTPYELGGGMVKAVSKWGHEEADNLTDREHAGTPNILGAITLACALEALDHIGIEEIFEQEKALTAQAIKQLQHCRSITIYGDKNSSQRLGAISFNLAHIGHGLVAAILNDYHGIAVRNECFCAHPYVQSMLSEEFAALDIEQLNNDEVNQLFENKRGMVRASFGLYTQPEDISALVAALKDIEDNIEHYQPLYKALKNGDYQHLKFQINSNKLFDIEQELKNKISGKTGKGKGKEEKGKGVGPIV